MGTIIERTTASALVLDLIKENQRLCKQTNEKVHPTKEYFQRNLASAQVLYERNDTLIYQINRELKVKPAFTKDDRIVLHFNLTHDGRKSARKYSEHIATHKFGAKYAAKHFIDRVTSTFKTRWLDDQTLLVNEWFSITCDDLAPTTLEKIMEYTFDKDEAKWRLPHPYPQYADAISRFHRGAHPDINSISRAQEGKQRLTETELTALGITPPIERKKRPSERPRPPERAKRAHDPDAISLAQLCTKLKIDPKEARQALLFLTCNQSHSLFLCLWFLFLSRTLSLACLVFKS